MLSNDVQETPRPRPPAKVRRCSSALLKASPPPPYAKTPFPAIADSSEAPIFLGSPITMADKQADVVSAEDWVNEKSREELSELLLKADGLIKDRESELGVTSAVCKSLYENNINLKNKHEALLARIPSSRAQSPIVSPALSTTPLTQTPHYYSASLSRASSTAESGAASPTYLSGYPRFRHARRISVSPSDIALLSDQNAELLQKLEKLETESAAADQAGRRKLRKLEKEIQGLRDELEKTQAKSEELEEKANANGGFGSMENLLRRKEEREERVRALRRKPGDADEEGSDEIRDFAPGGPAAMRNSPQRPTFATGHAPRLALPTSPPPAINLSTKPSLSSLSLSQGVSHKSSLSSLRHRSSFIRSSSQPQLEYALVSQLLLKIRELEETNTQITSQQAETAVKLQAVQRDAESISKVYDCLGDDAGVEWELVVDSEPQEECTDQQQSTPVGNSSNTIRLRSLRRTIDGGLMKVMADDDVFDSGIKDKSTSDMNFKGATLNKSRKSVVGLFDQPGSIASGDTRAGTRISSSSSTIPGIPVPFPLDTDTDTDIDLPTWAAAPASPTLTMPVSETLREGAGPTLSSELGSEFGDDWGANAGNHHLRTSSLYDLTHLSVEPSPSPDPTSEMECTGFPETPTPNHEMELPGGDHEQLQPWRGNQTLRYRRMSQAVHSRTNQWADGRFSESLLGTRGSRKEDAEGARTEVEPPLPPIPQRLSGVFNEVMDTLSNDLEDDTEHPADTSAVELHAGSVVEKSVPKHGVTAFVLELWLWLQFAVIILVFLWAMARRGPKSVLDEAEKRRRAAQI